MLRSSFNLNGFLSAVILSSLTLFGSKLNANDYFLWPLEEGKPIDVCPMVENTKLFEIKTKTGVENDILKNIEIVCFENGLLSTGTKNDIVFVLFPRNHVEFQGPIKLKIDLNVRQYFVDQTYPSELCKTSPGKASHCFKNKKEIRNAGEIFVVDDSRHKFPTIDINEFIEFVRSKGSERATSNGFLELVQYNLTKPYVFKNGNKYCYYEDGFYSSEVDGLWGPQIEDALHRFTQCEGDGRQITAEMISNFLLPQLFKFVKRNSTEDITDGEASNTPDDDASPDPDVAAALKAQNSANLQNDEIKSEPSKYADNPTQVIFDDKDEENEALKGENAELASENKELKSRQDKYAQEINDLKQTIKNLNDQDITRNLPIFQIWEDELPVRVLGQYPGGQLEEGTKKLKSYPCKISVADTLYEASIEAYEADLAFGCFDYVFENGEVNTSEKPSFNAEKMEITVQLFKEQIKNIVSLKTQEIEGLTKKYRNNCLIDLSFIKDDQIVMSFASYENEGGLFVVDGKNGNDAFWILSDEGTLKDFGIAYDGLSVRLETPKDDLQKCYLPSNIPMPITTGYYVPTGSPQALVDREGNLVLHDLRIAVTEGRTLAVFFDTNVGFEAEETNAFNKSLDKPEFVEVQKIYFSGFSDALIEYLSVQSEFENIKIYQSYSSQEATELGENYFFKDLFQQENIQEQANKNVTVEFLEEFKSDFSGGKKGPFDPKIRKVRELMKEYSSIKFLSFGSSGLRESEVCKSSQRAPFDSNFMIFDVWTAFMNDELEDKGTTVKIERPIWQCTDDAKIFGLRISKNSESSEINGPVFKYLKRFLGD